MSERTKDYEVGYGRPPKHTRFQKGRSGNPKGRPKDAKGFAASLKRELEVQIPVREGSRTIRISKAEAAAKRLVATALQGDMKALAMLAKFDSDMATQVEANAGEAAGSFTPEAVDYDILREFFAGGADGDSLIEDQENDDDNR